jgi:peptidoglycan/LPS O-acetylase OafA/YrhL
VSATADPGAGGIESGSAAATQRFPGLDAYRAIGMTMVMLIHVHASTNDVPGGYPGDVLRRMDLGLEIFFVLSGFLIFRPFVLALLSDRPGTPTRKYLRRRVLRIFPGYWFALVMAFILFGEPVQGVKGAVVFFGLLQSFVSDPQLLHGGIEQSWTLMTELTFYAFLPVFAAVLASFVRGRQAAHRVRVMLVGVGLLYLFGVLFRIAIVLISQSQTPEAGVVPLAYRMTLWMPGHLDLFAVGMAFAVFSAHAARGGGTPRAITWLADRPNVSWAIGGILFFVMTLSSPPDEFFHFGAEYSMRLFGYGVIAAFLLVPSFFGDQSKGALRRFLASPVMVYLGTVSLGFYLWHLHILEQLREWMDLSAFEGTTGDFVKLGVLTFLLALVAASFSYFVVERPFLRLKDRPVSSLWRREAGARA